MVDIPLVGLRDRRVAASEETRSVKGGRLYGRRSAARWRGPRRAQGYDRDPSELLAIILHQTAGAFFLPSSRVRRDPTRGPYPSDPRRDSDVQSDHAIDRIGSHFVVMNDGLVFYTHDVAFEMSGGRRGTIDIEFAGSYDEDTRLSDKAIDGGRDLVRALKWRLPSVRHIHPHGQVQTHDRQGRCGGSTGNTPDKLNSCPGPDIWVNVGEWAVRELGLICDETATGLQNNGISPAQRNQDYLRLAQEEPIETAGK